MTTFRPRTGCYWGREAILLSKKTAWSSLESRINGGLFNCYACGAHDHPNRLSMILILKLVVSTHHLGRQWNSEKVIAEWDLNY
jgi:hypothetical protein